MVFPMFLGLYSLKKLVLRMVARRKVLGDSRVCVDIGVEFRGVGAHRASFSLLMKALFLWAAQRAISYFEGGLRRLLSVADLAGLCP